MIELILELLKFIGHKKDCDNILSYDYHKCNCGMEELQKKVKEKLAKALIGVLK